jgi:acylglycerol lipase
MSIGEGFLDYPDRSSIRYRLNNRPSSVSAILLHGLGERLEMYDYLYPAFERAGIALHALELRGHGESSGAHKYISDFELYVKDLKRFITSFLKESTPYLIGHSTGGLVALRTAEDTRFPIRGLVLTSPLVEMKLNPVLRFMLPIFSMLAPQLIIPDKEENFYQLTHEEQIAQMLADESRRTLFGVRLGFVGAFLRARKRFLEYAHIIREIPSLLLLADEDVILDVQRIEAIFTSIYRDSPNLTVLRCSDCYHAILLEQDRASFVERIIRWIQLQESGNKEGSPA